MRRVEAGQRGEAFTARFRELLVALDRQVAALRIGAMRPEPI